MNKRIFLLWLLATLALLSEAACGSYNYRIPTDLSTPAASPGKEHFVRLPDCLQGKQLQALLEVLERGEALDLKHFMEANFAIDRLSSAQIDECFNELLKLSSLATGVTVKSLRTAQHRYRMELTSEAADHLYLLTLDYDNSAEPKIVSVRVE